MSTKAGAKIFKTKCSQCHTYEKVITWNLTGVVCTLLDSNPHPDTFRVSCKRYELDAASVPIQKRNSPNVDSRTNRSNLDSFVSPNARCWCPF